MSPLGGPNPLGDVSLALLGAGRMGGAMLRGWLGLGLEGAAVSVFDPQPGPDLLDLCRERGIALNPSAGPARMPEIVVLAVKPQMLDAAVPTLLPLVGDATLLLSVVAGKTVADIAARVPRRGPIVRAMPNTPAAVGRGITGVVAPEPLTETQRGRVDALLGAIGRVEWLRHEREIDAVTAVSGSGPAYVFYLAECLAKAGEQAGLAPDLAARLARATVEGAGELMYRDADTDPSVLRRNVTSPGGTTAAGLEVLAGPAGLEPLLARTVAAARRRAEELGG